MFFVVAIIYDYDYQLSKARQSRQTDRQSEIRFSYLGTPGPNMIDVEWKARYTARR